MARSPNWSYASYDEDEAISVIGNYIWDTGTLAWIKQTAAAAGGGGPVTIADGADVAEGSRADVAWVSGSGTVISLLKTIASASGAGGLTDAQLRATPVPVSGTVTGNIASIDGEPSLANAQVSVTTTSAVVVAARAGRRSLLIVNHGTTDVYLGTGTVTTANGVLLKGTAGASISIPTVAAVNGIVASGTQTVSYIEVF